MEQSYHLQRTEFVNWKAPQTRTHRMSYKQDPINHTYRKEQSQMLAKILSDVPERTDDRSKRKIIAFIYISLTHLLLQ